MGIMPSRDSGLSDESDDSVENSNLFRNFFDNPVTDDLLIEMLSFVPERDLILNCQFVCKRWKMLIDGQTIWRRKCERENVKLPSRRLPKLPKHHYRYLYQFSTAKDNLILNPSGEDKLLGWQIQYPGAHGFIVENPAVGADPVPIDVGSESCFATSFEKCRKHQIIDLYKKKYHKYLLINGLVTIKIGEWYGTRFDCGSEYDLKVQLFDNDMGYLENFRYKYTCEQWNGGQWFFVDHEFTEVTKVRFVHFEHTGNDTQYWSGHYGSKFTGAFVKLCLV